MTDSQAGVALAAPSFRDTLHPIASTVGAQLHILQSRQPGRSEQDDSSLQQQLSGASPDESGALIMYTSGTTGRPKGVPDRNTACMVWNVLGFCQQLGSWRLIE